MSLALATLALLTFSAIAAAQTPSPASSTTPSPAPSTITAADKFEAERIPRNSKFFIGNFYQEGDAEKLAKYLKKKIEDDEKKALKMGSR
jgi:hypothetical protein